MAGRWFHYIYKGLQSAYQIALNTNTKLMFNLIHSGFTSLSKYKRNPFRFSLLLLYRIQAMEINQAQSQYLAIIISEVKSSSRELYPLTKNYPMALLPIGTKKLITYQLESLIPIQHIAKVVLVVTQQDNFLRPYLESQFLTKHRQYPHPVQFFTVKEINNTFAAVKELLISSKSDYKGYILIHGDTLIGTPLTDLFNFHENRRSQLTFLLKAKRELTEQEKKLLEGEFQTQLDNVLLGEKGEVLFIDMADELQTNGVTLDPSIYLQVKKASFKKALDSKMYLFNQRVARIMLQLSADQIYEFRPWFTQLLVQHQTNKQLLNISKKEKDENIERLKVFAYFCEQDAFIRKISNKKIFEALNFDSLIRGAKQKELLLPNTYSERMEHRAGHTILVAQNATMGAGCKVRRCVISPGCRIGKNVQLYNSILLENVELKDNCKITECVLGAGTIVGENAQIKSTYSESGCRVADSVKLEFQTLIRNE